MSDGGILLNPQWVRSILALHCNAMHWGDTITVSTHSFIFFLSCKPKTDIDQRLKPQTVYICRTPLKALPGLARCDNLSTGRNLHSIQSVINHLTECCLLGLVSSSLQDLVSSKAGEAFARSWIGELTAART